MSQIDSALTDYLAVNTRVTSDSTRKHYDITFRQFDQFLGRRARLRDLTDDHLAGFMCHLLDRGRAIPTVNQKRHYVCAFWRWCARKNRVSFWPTVQPLIEPETFPDAWTLDELGRIFAACKDQEVLSYGCVARNLPA